MNYIDFDQTGGFPLSTDILTFMQENQDFLQEIAEGFGTLTNVGDAVVIHGCVDNGTTITPGLIYLKKSDGTKELLPFLKTASLRQDYYYITGTTEQKEFYDGDCKDVMYTRWCELTSTITDYPTSALIKTKTVAELTTEISGLTTQVNNLTTTVEESSVPVGLISMWSGSIANIPDGWALCNGTNGTPNLSGRFIVGYGRTGSDDDYAIGETGGKQSVLLSAAQSGLPVHKHGFNILYSGGTLNTAVSAPGQTVRTVGLPDPQYIANSGGTDAQSSHENRPPYYVLAYIMKL